VRFFILFFIFFIFFDFQHTADCSDDLTNPTPLLDALLHLTAKALSLTANLNTFYRVVSLVESLVKVRFVFGSVSSLIIFL
jgi:hypothetical protein